jgi:hypothetical protein
MIWLSWFHIISGDLLMIVFPLIMISHNDWAGAFRSSNCKVQMVRGGVNSLLKNLQASLINNC